MITTRKDLSKSIRVYIFNAKSETVILGSMNRRLIVITVADQQWYDLFDNLVLFTTAYSPKFEQRSHSHKSEKFPKINILLQ